MPCGWEGNRKSVVVLAMRHTLQWFIHLRAHGLRKGDEHPAYTLHGVGIPFVAYVAQMPPVAAHVARSWAACVSVCLCTAIS